MATRDQQSNAPQSAAAAPEVMGDRLADNLARCEAAACSCRPMVERAYRELVGKGQPDDHALDAAIVVLRWHHPEVPMPEAGEIVQRWVADGRVH